MAEESLHQHHLGMKSGNQHFQQPGSSLGNSLVVVLNMWFSVPRSCSSSRPTRGRLGGGLDICILETLSEVQKGVEQLLWVFYHMPGPGAPDLRSLISTNSLPAASLPFLGQIIAGKSHFIPKTVCSLFCVWDHSLPF